MTDTRKTDVCETKEDWHDTAAVFRSKAATDARKAELRFTESREVDSKQAEAEDTEVVIEKRPTVYESSEPAAQKYLVLKTIFLTYAHICLGIMGGLMGVTQLDLRDQLEANVTMEHMGITLSSRSLGSLCASIMTGLAVDRYEDKSDLFLGIGMGMAALVMFIKPWVRYFWGLMILMFFEGMGCSTENITVNIILVRLWGPDGASPMQILHLGYGIGFFVAPLMAAPFLATRDSDEDEVVKYTPPSPMVTSSSQLSTVYFIDTYTVYDDNYRESRIEVPYTLAGLLVSITSILAVIFYILGPPKTLKMFTQLKTKLSKVFSLEATGVDSMKFAVTIITLVLTFYFLLAARDIPISSYIYSYAVESDHGFSSRNAALLDAAVKASLMVGRAIASILARYIAVQPMLFFEVYIGAVSCLMLATVGTRESVALWVFSCLTMLLASPVWPGGYTWADTYFILTGTVVAGVDVFAAISGLIFNWLVGYLYANIHPDAIMYYMFIMAVIFCVVLLVMQIIASSRGPRTFSIGEIRIGESDDIVNKDKSASNPGFIVNDSSNEKYDITRL